VVEVGAGVSVGPLVGEVVAGAIGPVVAGRVVVDGGVEVGITVEVVIVGVGLLERVVGGTTAVGATVAVPLRVSPAVGVGAGWTSR
jgi:hypothetical protein